MRLFIIGLSLIVILLIGVFVTPQLIDWNKYKAQIVEQIKSATGIEVVINGDLSVAVLPSPHVQVKNLTVISPNKITFDNLLTLKEAEVQVSLTQILQKKIDVQKVRLIEPNITLEILNDGRPAWETDKIAQMTGAKEKMTETMSQVSEEASQKISQATTEQGSALLDQITVNKLEIQDGNIHFIDHAKGSVQKVENINVSLSAKSLNGPFKLEGDLKYQEDQIALNANTGKLPKESEALPIKVSGGISNRGLQFSFDGLTTIQGPVEIQGKLNAKLKTLEDVIGYNKALEIDGLITVSEDTASINDLKLSLDGFTTTGKIQAQNLKAKNPVQVVANLDSSDVLDISPFMASNKKAAQSSSENSSNSDKEKPKDILPSTLALPIDINMDVKANVGGVELGGHMIKGVFADLSKEGGAMNASFRLADVVGQGAVNGRAGLKYASKSKSGDGGQVVYSEPQLSYAVEGQIADIKNVLKAFAPDLKDDQTQMFKSAHFDIKGGLNNGAITLKDSVVKLDDMTAGLSGSYKLGQSRPVATIDVSIDQVDADRFVKQPQGGDKNSSSNTGGGKPKEIKGFALPLDVTFDASIQKVRYQGKDISGVRAIGAVKGNTLSLQKASINNFSGASINVKGSVGNTEKLTGLDLNGALKTSNITSLLNHFKVDTSKLPAGLKAVDAQGSAKGDLNQLSFSSNVKAMGGQLDVSGLAGQVMASPTLDDLTIGLKHPNLVKAIQIVSPEFKGQAGLQQTVSFFAKAKQEGKTYHLSDMKASLGKTSVQGNLSVDTSNKITAVRGAVKGDKIRLDELLGGSSASSSGKKSSSSSSKPQSKERWSQTPIDLSWMDMVDVDVKLSANQLIHGHWVLENPATDLKIANGVMNVQNMRVGIFGGNANMSTTVKAQPVSVSLSSTMQGINLEKLAKALSGGDKLKSSGTVDFSMDVATTGGSAHALINALNGKASVDGTNIALEGFDLAKMARGLAVEEKLATSIGSLVDGATKGGSTKFDTLKGTYKVENGTVRISAMALDGPDALIDSTGYTSLPEWFINVDNQITLKAVADLSPFNVKIKGPLDNPGDTFGKKILEDYLADKLKRKIAKEIPNILGDDVGDKLKQFGILPQDPQPAPVEQQGSDQVPANDNEKPQQQEEQPAADPLQRILQDPNNAEDAVKDVLKGLF